MIPQQVDDEITHILRRKALSPDAVTEGADHPCTASRA
jgi:hypothetical protein